MAHLLEALEVTVRDGGADTILLAHGFGTTQRVWDPIVDRLAGRHRVITFNLAGATATSLEAYHPVRHGTLDGFAEDVVSILDALHVDRVTYIGHSVSGMVGVLAAGAAPTLFDGLVLVGASARYVDDPAAHYVGGFHAPQVEALLANMEHDYIAWANGFSTLAMDNPDRPDLAASFAQSLKALPPEVAVATFAAILRSDHREAARQVGRLGIRTRVLQARTDAAVALSAAQWLAEATRGDLHLLDVDGHFPHIVAPDLVLHEFLEFLTDDTGAAARGGRRMVHE